MPDFLAPGVSIEETGRGPRAIVGVGTSTAAFVGPTRAGPLLEADGGERPAPLTGFADFEQQFGSDEDLDLGGAAPVTHHLAHAVRAYFDNGGTRLYVVRAQGSDATLPVGREGPMLRAADYARALQVLATLDDVSTVAAPGLWHLTVDAAEARLAAQALITHAEQPGLYRFAVLDAPLGATSAELRDLREAFDSRFAALYAPGVVVARPAARPPARPLARPGRRLPATRTLTAAGFVCGIFARVDRERGVFKAPANETVQGALRVERAIGAAEQAVLNPLGINVLRTLQGRGLRVWGARTMSSDPEWKYVNVRRYLSYLAASIDRGTQWAVFEPNDEPLWDAVRRAVANFLLEAWRGGALQGSKPEEAFFVRCDRTTMTRDDLDHGRLVCLVGVAVVKPAEFIVFRVGQRTAAA